MDGQDYQMEMMKMLREVGLRRELYRWRWGWRWSGAALVLTGVMPSASLPQGMPRPRGLNVCNSE